VIPVIAAEPDSTSPAEDFPILRVSKFGSLYRLVFDYLSDDSR